MAPPNKRNWTTEEDALLLRTIADAGIPEAAKIIGVDYETARRRAMSLKAHIPVKRHPWDAERMARLREMWPTHTIKEIADEFGLSHETVRKRALYIGLRRDDCDPVSRRVRDGLPCPWLSPGHVAADQRSYEIWMEARG